MAAKTPQPKGRKSRSLSTLDTLTQILDVAKVACVIPPAQAAIGSASTLLTMIKVPSLPFRGCEFPVHGYSGLHGR